MKIILASASPRRKELLYNIVDDFSVIVSDIDENIEGNEPKYVAEMLSKKKAEAVALKINTEAGLYSEKKDENYIVIGADTIVFTDRILGKPSTEEEAELMLSELSGRVHEVITGVTVISTINMESRTFSVVTEVEFKRLNEDEIKKYIKSKESMDKAGAYAIQGRASKFIKGIKGCYFNVVGLPLYALAEEIKLMGYEE